MAWGPREIYVGTLHNVLDTCQHIADDVDQENDVRDYRVKPRSNMMIACQIEVDGLWRTGCYVADNVEAVKKRWSRELLIPGIKTIEIMQPTDPYWKAEYFADSHWVSYLGESQGDLRAMLFLYSRLAVSHGLPHADVRIKRWQPVTLSGIDPLLPAILGTQ